MGNGNSKPDSSITQHVFSADAPVRFSNELVTKLQDNPESDSTRRQNQELKFQSRLTSELEKLNSQESTSLTKLTEQVTSEPLDDSSSPSLTEKIGDAVSSSAALAEKQRQKDMSRDFVQKEIDALKKKLEGRKKLEAVDDRVGKAKEDVVNCLRLNDRRPLDCWQEVETFREEVGRLEKLFVEKTIR